MVSKFTIEDCEEAFLLRDRFEMQLTVTADGKVLVHRDGELLWHQPIFNQEDASAVLAGMVGSIYSAFSELGARKQVFVFKKGPEGP